MQLFSWNYPIFAELKCYLNNQFPVDFKIPLKGKIRSISFFSFLLPCFAIHDQTFKIGLLCVSTISFKIHLRFAHRTNRTGSKNTYPQYMIHIQTARLHLKSNVRSCDRANTFIKNKFQKQIWLHFHRIIGAGDVRMGYYKQYYINTRVPRGNSSCSRGCATKKQTSNIIMKRFLFTASKIK